MEEILLLIFFKKCVNAADVSLRKEFQNFLTADLDDSTSLTKIIEKHSSIYQSEITSRLENEENIKIGEIINFDD